MPSNSVVKTSLIVGGLSFLGLLAGGKMGSMLGAVIGTVVCSMFSVEEPISELIEENPRITPYSRPSNTNQKKKNKVNKSKNEPCELPKCSICLEPFQPSLVLLPCTHMCFCDDCYADVKRKKVSACPICRERIVKFIHAC